MNTTFFSPVNKINENVVRLTSFFVFLITLCCTLSGNFWAVSFLTVDYGLRAFYDGKFSLLKIISLKFTSELNLPVKLQEIEPRKFAAGLGFFLCLLIVVLYGLNLNKSAALLSFVLLTFTFLDSAINFCIGCYIYVIKNSAIN